MQNQKRVSFNAKQPASAELRKSSIGSDGRGDLSLEDYDKVMGGDAESSLKHYWLTFFPTTLRKYWPVLTFSPLILGFVLNAKEWGDIIFNTESATNDSAGILGNTAIEASAILLLSLISIMYFHYRNQKMQPPSPEELSNEQLKLTPLSGRLWIPAVFTSLGIVISTPDLLAINISELGHLSTAELAKDIAILSQDAVILCLVGMIAMWMLHKHESQLIDTNRQIEDHLDCSHQGSQSRKGSGLKIDREEGGRDDDLLHEDVEGVELDSREGSNLSTST